MSTRDDLTTEHDERYHEAVAAYLQALDAGSDPDRRHWLDRYPDIAQRLEAFFADHDRMSAARRSPAGQAIPPWQEPTRSFHMLPLLSDDEVSHAVAVQAEPGFGALATAKGHLPLKAMEVNAQVEGLLAHVTVCQTFVNTLEEPIEATYIFPLPDRMAVTRFHMEVAGREVEGVLKERAAARQEYAAALKEGHRAAITEEERPGVFTMRVGNLMPGEEAVVHLALVGPLPYSNGEATFRFPLVVAPRYVPGRPLAGPTVGTGTAADTDAAPDASRVTPPTLLSGYPNPVRLALAVDVHPSGIPLRDFRCSLHAVIHAEDGDGVRRIMLQAGEWLDRDFILRFRVGEGAVRTALALLPDAEGSKEGTFALTIVPPEESLQVQRPRDIVFVLDRSGSMQGWKMVAARRALARMVDTLTDEDRFNVFAFDSHIETPPQLSGTQVVPAGQGNYYRAEEFLTKIEASPGSGALPPLGAQLFPADHRNRYWAVEFLTKIEARGGTEMYQPLGLATHVLAGGDARRERILVLVTDGQVANEQQILRNLGPRARNLRIFALGIDKAVNEAFLRQVAGLGNGSHEIVESEARLEEVSEQIHRRIANPVLTNLRLEANGFELVPDSLVPGRLPDLFSGAALCVWGRYRGAAQGALVVQARAGDGKPWFATVSARRSHNPAIAPLWGRGRVRELEDRFAIAPSDRQQIEREIVSTSLRFGVLCRFTSFVAVDRVNVVNPGGQVQPVTQAVERPAGWARTESPAASQFRASPGPGSGGGGSIQHKLDRVRRPRVQITYDLETGGAMRKVELPFVVGVLADLSGQPKEALRPLKDRKAVMVDRDNFNDVMAKAGVRLAMRVANTLNDPNSKLAVELNFKSIDDFEPARVAAQVDTLRELLTARQRVVHGDDRTKPEALALMDQRMSAQLAAIMHHPDFQRLEATWRGLHYLVHQSETGENLKIRVLNVSKRELLDDQEKAAEFDQSVLFKKIYEEEDVRAGGKPYGLLVGDYEFGCHPEDIRLLQAIASVAAAAHAPFVAAAAPLMFGLDRWTGLTGHGESAKLFTGAAYAAWNSFRESEDSRYVALTLPRILARLPYGSSSKPVPEFNFEELADGAGLSQYLWMNAAWAYATRVTDAFAKYGWCARTKGVGGGGKVEGLPAHPSPTDGVDVATNCPTEIAISEQCECELSSLGFLALCQIKGVNTAAFLDAQSCHKPRQYADPAATANASLSTKLNVLLCTCRFGHYLKAIGSACGATGSALEAMECQRRLNEWIKNYVLDPKGANDAMMARRPLAEARVIVSAGKGKPGWYEVVAYLRPHLQLQAQTTSMRLTFLIKPGR